ncbi:trypsin-like peptidase domain-containing protein [Trichlorobacter lovleyi]|uniref:trypsin-like peptidase domain-containing protein n=1 Tax=Trichlorobacter lovleyi TaxID=313985 RepID=UPI0022403BDF|nr:trypsin-like peptidase domain-containing protein [Trichlorobacter lovleyi]QOX77711.1 trypsin-like peptidase domain-containing protein [Trichlorobacter lovleyi]
MMRTPIRLLLLISAAVILGSCSSSKDEPLFFKSKRPAAEAEPPVKDVPADILSTQRAFSQVSKKVTPIVVNISTISRKKLVRPFPDLPPLFEEFFGGGPQTRRDKSLGSGFIISRDGFIVTNEHVVRDAESIRVKLSNDKVYEARVVGGDPKTDIAVIKIDAGDLPVAVLGDSDRLEVGQWAIAIGNPFGLERSMTVGIISATGRSNVGIESIENFIQTDASINPGNSGGPLLNIHGEVVGINTAIVAAGQGIGFAIPTNMARPIISQLVEKGKVTRAWLGVSIKPVTEEEARSLGLSKPAGVVIAAVQGDGPAAKGGLQAGDLVVAFGSSEVRDPSHLQQLVAVTRIGAAVPVVVLRGGRKITVTVKPGNADSAPSARRIEQEDSAR